MENKEKENLIGGEIVIYENKNGVSLEVSLKEETIWLSQDQMARLFNKDRNTISEHIRNVYSEGELEEKATARNFRSVQKEGNREVKRSIDNYSLDVIISVGYRVKSLEGTRFRIWATQTLRKYLIDGYVVSEKRLLESKVKNLEEFQETIKFITNKIENKVLKGKEKDVLKVIKDYTKSFQLA